jgi:hypothetical protein
MRNPFTKKKKKLPLIAKTIVSNNTISGPIGSLPSNLTGISIGNGGYYGSSGISGSIRGASSISGPIQGASSITWGFSSASTFTYMDPEEVMKQRKAELMKEFEQNPELFSEIIVELRQRKIRQLKDKSQSQT